MRPISSFKTMEELEEAFGEWFNTHFQAKHTFHSEKVSQPIPREPQFWKGVMMEAADAMTWAENLANDSEDMEVQALGLLTESMTVAEAKGRCHRILRSNSALKRLSKSAEKKLSCLQSLNKN